MNQKRPEEIVLQQRKYNLVKDAMPVNMAFAIIGEESGKQFDPEVVADLK